MEQIIREIINREQSEKVLSFREIKGFGTVNTIFDIRAQEGNYILRLNRDDKRLEYKKEKWCIDKIGGLGIPTAEVLSIGMINEYCFMIQRKIPGINGAKCESKERINIWLRLGEYAATYQQIKRIEEEEFERTAFHKDWKARLEYNLKELNKEDILIREGILSKREQKKAREALDSLRNKEFEMGLVHGDLSPRNVILNNGKIHLLDWGTAEVNIVPHNEIGIVLMSKEASNEAFTAFLSGLGIAKQEYLKIEEEINLLNFLHQLDIYRWAEGQGIAHLNDYPLKVKQTFDRIK